MDFMICKISRILILQSDLELM